MADNIAVTPGSGATLAADDISGVLYRRSKLSLGADGSAADAVGGAGAVSSAVQRVTLASDDPAVAVLEALQKAEDAAHSSGDKGIQALTVRADTAAAKAGTDGDYQPLITDANGRLHVIDVTGTAVQFAEDAAHVSGDKGVVALAVRRDTAAVGSGTDGDYSTLNVDANGRLHVLDANSATIAALSKAEDAAHSSADTGIVALARRKDTPAVSSGTDGDYSTVDVSANGKLWVEDRHKNVSVTPTVSASPDYAQYDAVGGIQTLTNACIISGGTSKLESLVIIDKAGVSPQFDVLIFNQNPAAATITDNAAFDPSTDVANIVARIPVVTADWQLVTAGIGVANVAKDKLGQVLTASGSANLYACVVARGSINLASTGDLIFVYGFAQK